MGIILFFHNYSDLTYKESKAQGFLNFSRMLESCSKSVEPHKPGNISKNILWELLSFLQVLAHSLSTLNVDWL